MLGGEAAGRILVAYGYPNGYAWCFAAAFVVQTLGVLPLAWMREPAGREWHLQEDSSPGGRGVGAAGLLSVAGDPRLRGLVLAYALFCGTAVAVAFQTDYAMRRFGASPGTIAHFTSAAMGAQVIANLLIGWVADRQGNRRGLQVATFSGFASCVILLLAPSLGWMYPVFGLAQIGMVGWSICWVNYVLEICAPRQTASYIAVVSLLLGPFRIGLPLLGGWLVGHAGYATVFILSAGMTLLSLVGLLGWVPEPRHHLPHALSEETAGTGTR